MNDAVSVHVANSVHDCAEQSKGILRGHRPKVLQAVIERLPIHILHYYARQTVRLDEIVKRRNPWMVEPRLNSRLVSEALLHGFPSRLAQNLDRDDPSDL